jgi:uncharacterized integral membrane protein
MKRTRVATGGEVIVAERVDTQVRERRRLSGGAIISLIGVAVLLIFIFQNTSSINVRFLFLRFSWPLWLYTIATAVAGALVWFGLGVMRRHRRRVERRESRR